MSIGTLEPLKLNQKPQALIAICTACFVTSLQDVTIKWMSGSYPFHEMQTIRCGVALICVLAWVVSTGGIRSLLIGQLPLALLRGALLAVASILFYIAAAGMKYPEAVAIYFTMPLIVVILAGVVMKEHVAGFRWAAVTIGFAGVLFILRPGSALFAPIALVALASALFYALGNVLTRPLSGRATAAPLAFWQTLMYFATAVLLSLVFGAGQLHITSSVSLDYLTRGWMWPSAMDLAIIVALGFSTAFLMIVFTHAYRLADSSFVAPFEFSAMLWAVLFSFGILHQLPDLIPVAGIALIMASGLFLAGKDRSASAPKSQA